ncbi:hypothetical protein JHK82_034386 [Glycine max]|uniref:Uncharacterized protein n=2 Tax=Glycine subgen. Soja TaxID=1462606 RepID=A0A0R0H815_SOYBN|nr:hypothetical protein JHK87_034327 [Glycine soja]KAG4981137.1 hypothetical protein JHK85_035095 [Glycine max]KAG4986765.1 hypothetical protein JHK86_034456 [Glycine max]KAG5119966.1 hypothetical protein JHK82_034386 [Glycine max]KAG5140952.1 hypothetical protein JHK84_034720 [Glycine max]
MMTMLFSTLFCFPTGRKLMRVLICKIQAREILEGRKKDAAIHTLMKRSKGIN